MKQNNTPSEQKLKEIENELVETVASLSFLKGRSSKTARTIAYIYIYRKVTQKMLRELTGYSLGTVSNTLRSLEKMGFVNKIQDQKTREYVYELEGFLPQSGSRAVSNMFEYFTQIKEFLDKTKIKLNQPQMSNKKGFENVSQFVNKMSGAFPSIEQIILETMDSALDKKEDAADQ